MYKLICATKTCGFIPKIIFTVALYLGILVVGFCYVERLYDIDDEDIEYLNFSKRSTSPVSSDVTCTSETYKELALGIPHLYYNGLTRILPKKVGERRIISIEDKNYTIITHALVPPIFEIPNYLSSFECASLMTSAMRKGLFPSTIVGQEKETFDHNGQLQRKLTNIKNRTRVSDQAWLFHSDALPQHRILESLTKRLISVTGLPSKIIRNSEAMQVVRYGPGGHYHAHMDSSEYDADIRALMSKKEFDHLPCCHQTFCPLGKERKCCRFCRYMTVMYYLNDVKEGGQTAFVKAKTQPNEKDVHQFSVNLSYNCSDAKLLLTPRKGSAIIWYNHFIDPKTGWLGEPDHMSMHGGCDVIRGEKWIANNWINVPFYKSRFKDAIYS